VAGAQGDGIWVGRADDSGVAISSAADDGLHVSSAGDDGVYVANAVDDGLQVSADDDGVHVVSAGDRGVYANTARADHQWGLYTPDRIYAGTTLASSGPLMFVAQNGDTRGLETGDVVAAAGLGAPFADSPSLVTLVRRADATSGTAVVGVVYSRFVAEEEVEEIEHEGQMARHICFDTHGTEGTVAPGEYLLFVVLGTCEAKVDATAGAIRPGDRLSLSSAQGRAARAQALTLDGVSFYPPGVTFGTALAPLEEGTGTIPVFVNPQ
jgi:hypothetical protein